MTAISFKSESTDNYLEITEVEDKYDLIKFINDLESKYGEEWAFLSVLNIKSTTFKTSVVSNLVERSISRAYFDSDY